MMSGEDGSAEGEEGGPRASLSACLNHQNELLIRPKDKPRGPGPRKRDLMGRMDVLPTWRTSSSSLKVE